MDFEPRTQLRLAVDGNNVIVTVVCIVTAINCKTIKLKLVSPIKSLPALASFFVWHVTPMLVYRCIKNVKNFYWGSYPVQPYRCWLGCRPPERKAC